MCSIKVRSIKVNKLRKFSILLPFKRKKKIPKLVLAAHILKPE